MLKSANILVFCPIFNEGQHLLELISSVLQQSLSDFTFLVSDNHSTDSSPEILASVADERLITVKPPHHLPSLEHLHWLNKLIQTEYCNYNYSAFVGGHDLWSLNYLETLYIEMQNNQNCVLSYSDTFEISSDGSILRKYPININTNGIIKPLRPIYILNGLTHNTTFGGLWRENVRRNIINQKLVCAALDHLYLAKASLYGDITYVPGTSMFLRQAKDFGSLDAYFHKHLGLKKSDTFEGINDFKKQLAMAMEIQKLAVEGFPFYEQKPICDSLTAAMFNTYLSRYIGLLTFFEHAPDQLFSDERMKNILKLSEYAQHQATSLVSLSNYVSN